MYNLIWPYMEDIDYKLCTEAIRKFQADLESLPAGEIIDKYLRNGKPFIFKEEDDYFALKRIIGDFFAIDHAKVYVIGSCKMGFSINPSQTWKHVNEDSDIDIAIIDNSLFDLVWKEIFNMNLDPGLTDQTKKEDAQFQKFLYFLFRGWLRPDFFPFVNNSLRKQIFEFTKSLYGKHQRKISIGIFKSEHFFTKYHEENLNKIKDGRII